MARGRKEAVAQTWLVRSDDGIAGGTCKRQWMEKINQRRELAGDSTTLDGFWQMHYWNKEQQQSGDELVTMRPSTQRDMKCAMHKIWLPRFGPRKHGFDQTSELQKSLASLIGPKEEGKIGRQTALKFKSYSAVSSAQRSAWKPGSSVILCVR